MRANYREMDVMMYLSFECAPIGDWYTGKYPSFVTANETLEDLQSWMDGGMPSTAFMLHEILAHIGSINEWADLSIVGVDRNSTVYSFLSACAESAHIEFASQIIGEAVSAEAEYYESLDDKYRQSWIHYASDSRGIYIPLFFARTIVREAVTGIDEEDYDVLESGPEHDGYWEAWNSVLQSATMVASGVEYRLHQDGDLWLIPSECPEGFWDRNGY
jgi:hypothetical protein